MEVLTVINTAADVYIWRHEVPRGGLCRPQGGFSTQSSGLLLIRTGGPGRPAQPSLDVLGEFGRLWRGVEPSPMGPFLVILILALILGGLGFAVHVLWIVAVIVFLIWLVGLLLGAGRKSKT